MKTLTLILLSFAILTGCSDESGKDRRSGSRDGKSGDQAEEKEKKPDEQSRTSGTNNDDSDNKDLQPDDTDREDPPAEDKQKPDPEKPADKPVVSSGGGKTPVPVLYAKSFSGAKHHYCAISSAGKLYCWGSNQFRALGDGSETNKYSPVQVGDKSDWTRVATGAFHTCGIRAGQLWCWGSNAQGQQANGRAETDERMPAPVRIGTRTDWAEVAAGWWHGCALTKGGKLYCWGTNYYGQVGDGTQTSRYEPTLVKGDHDWASLHVGPESFHSCALTKAGKLYCWGHVLADGKVELRTEPTKVNNKTWKDLTVSRHNTCGIDDAGKLFCWGADNTYSKPISKSAEPGQIGKATDWVKVVIGGYNAFALKKDGSMYSWGYNIKGSAGTGSDEQVEELTKVKPSLTWSAVAGNERSSCALRGDGALYCSGQYSDAAEVNEFEKLYFDFVK